MAIKAPLYDQAGTRIDEIDLPESLFGAKPHAAVLHAYVRRYLNAQRQGTVKTKTRAEVSGGGAKPWRQKGTGRARAGSNSSPLWVGGGRVFGPRPRNHREKMPKKMRRLAFRSALSLRAEDGNVHIIEDVQIDPPKTKDFVKILQNIGVEAELVLFLTESKDITVGKSVRNLFNVAHRRAKLANPYEIMKHRCLLLTRAGLASLEEVFCQ